jgi:predicted Zn finger-like uncharacterized protein
MFTQCPSCKTTFQVTAEQLKAANGDVRCGQCLTVFNAVTHLSEIEPFHEEHDSAPNDISEELASDGQNPTPGDASTSIDKNLEEFFGDLFEDSPNETFDEPLTYANPEPSTENTPNPEDDFFYGANEATIEKILETEETSPPEATDEYKTEEDNETDVEAEEVELSIETDAEVEIVESSLNLGSETEQADSDATPEGSSSENKIESTELANVPHVILDELEAAKAQQLKPPSTQWVVGSIVLMLVFVLQAVYFSRDSLAKNPSYRPLLTSACNIIGCEINIEFDTRLIEIIGRDVRSHPTSKKALIAGTTIINNASYAQPYPLLTLTFSDITGTKLAQRRFTPREYLRNGTNIEAGMPSEIPVQVELHLVDPGKAAVNFEFRAEIDPRS